jgi:hypothetical protein
MLTISVPDHEALLSAALKGHNRAFAALVRPHLRMLYRLAVRSTNHPSLAEGAVQEAWMAERGPLFEVSAQEPRATDCMSPSTASQGAPPNVFVEGRRQAQLSPNGMPSRGPDRDRNGSIRSGRNVTQPAPVQMPGPSL